MAKAIATYVLGFAFDRDGEYLLLINKTKPQWQAGKLNGIGGKMELDELPKEAMIREFMEETGVHTNVEEWNYLGVMHGDDFFIHVYSLFHDCALRAHTTTEESVEIVNLDKFMQSQYALYPRKMIRNLKWLIAFALNKAEDPTLHDFEVRYL